MKYESRELLRRSFIFREILDSQKYFCYKICPKIDGVTIHIVGTVMKRYNNKHRPNPKGNASSTQWPERLKLSQAHKFLEISFAKMTALVNSGAVPWEPDPLDHRVKLVKRADLEVLKRQRG